MECGERKFCAAVAMRISVMYFLMGRGQPVYATA
jgi:hypothetical protein